MTTIAVKLTDQEWRLKCEELATEELRRMAKRLQLASEEEEFKARKKDLNAQIDVMTSKIELLAQEVDSKTAIADAQAELQMDPAAEAAADEKDVVN